MMDDAIPVLRAKEVYRRKKLVQLKVWCEYCETYHFHGVTEGHRIAHCKKGDSPYHRTGYEIKVGDQ